MAADDYRGSRVHSPRAMTSVMAVSVLHILELLSCYYAYGMNYWTLTPDS